MGGSTILKKRKRGLLTLELILVFPVLLLVLLAVVELGTYLLAAEAVQGAAMAGPARRRFPGATYDRISAAVVGALSGWSYASSLGPGNIQVVDLPSQAA